MRRCVGNVRKIRLASAVDGFNTIVIGGSCQEIGVRGRGEVRWKRSTKLREGDSTICAALNLEPSLVIAVVNPLEIDLRGRDCCRDQTAGWQGSGAHLRNVQVVEVSYSCGRTVLVQRNAYDV